MKRLLTLFLITALTACATRFSGDDFDSVSITYISGFHRIYTITASAKGLIVQIPISEQTQQTVNLPYQDAGEMSSLFFTSAAVYSCGRSHHLSDADAGSFYEIYVSNSKLKHQARVGSTQCKQQIALLELITKPIYERAIKMITKNAEQGA